MSAITYEGHVENGRIRLEREVRLPEKAKVYVVVAGGERERVFHLATPKLIRSRGARPLRLEITKEPANASTV